MTIGERVREVREHSTLNQRAFAKSINIGQSTLAMFETNQREVRDIHINAICSKYGVNEAWLRTGTGEPYNIPEDETAAIVFELLEEKNPTYDLILSIVKTYQKLDNKSRKILDDFIKEVSENLRKEG